MRSILIATALGCLVTAADASATRRNLEHRLSASGVERIVLEAGVGDVQIQVVSTSQIEMDVEVESTNGIFGTRRGRRAVETAEISADVHRGVLHLEIETHSSKKNIEENWKVRIPAGIAVSVESGVGDVVIEGVDRDVDIELGVGDVTIEGLHARFGSIEAEAGVGEISLRTPNRRESGRGFVGHSLRETGPGAAEIQVSVGVGEVEVKLD